MSNNAIVNVLNYSSHAIEDLEITNSIFKEMGFEHSRDSLQNIIEMLKTSVKFILPNCGEVLLDSTENLKQSHLDFMRLPFPIVTFEIPWDKKNQEADQYDGFLPQGTAKRRIALCWDMNSTIEPIIGLKKTYEDFYPEGGIFILPIYCIDSVGKWEMSMGGIFVPYNNKLNLYDESVVTPASKVFHDVLKDASKLLKKTENMKAEPFQILPEVFHKTVSQLGSQTKALAQIFLDSSDEAKAVIQACCSINCTNVGLADIEASKKLNKKREEKGKQPFFSYKVLQLNEFKKTKNRESLGGTHSSPRTHLRRGHLREVEDKLIWVRPAIVNPVSSKGIVEKDYRVLKKEQN